MYQTSVSKALYQASRRQVEEDTAHSFHRIGKRKVVIFVSGFPYHIKFNSLSLSLFFKNAVGFLSFTDEGFSFNKGFFPLPLSLSKMRRSSTRKSGQQNPTASANSTPVDLYRSGNLICVCHREGFDLESLFLLRALHFRFEFRVCRLFH